MSAISTKPNVPKKRSKLQETWRRFRKNGRAVVGLCIVIILVLCAVLAPIISPYEPNAQDPRNRLQGPSAGHWFGTDELGRDILSRIIYGARISMSVGLIAICISLIGGVTLGAIAGYYGGTIDNIIMRCMDVLLSIPTILLNISIVAALGSGLQNVMIAIGVSSIPGYCRIVRASILSLRGQDFVEASRAAGANDFFLITQHILPNCLAPLIVQATLNRRGDTFLRQHELPWPWHSAAHGGMGQHAFHWPRLPARCAACVHIPGPCHHGGGVQHEPCWRRTARCA